MFPAQPGHWGVGGVGYWGKVRCSTPLPQYPITEELEEAASEIFERYDDKDFSFTDCTSFQVMLLLGITEAFTNDHHFEQFGFVIHP